MFTQTLLELARVDRDILAVTSDASGSVTLDEFKKILPEQFVECGIAEQNEVGISSGLASCGKKPFVCAPAAFLTMRIIEQVKLDLAYSDQNVKIIGISGGVSYGALGMSHHSVQDIAVMCAIPNITVILPCDRFQTREMTRQLAKHVGPVYVRMGRGATPDVYTDEHAPFTIGKANRLRDGRDGTFIACGEMVYPALKAAELLENQGLQIRVIDMHTLKPLDEQAVLDAARETGYIVTAEEHSIHNGLGAMVASVVVQNNPVPMKILALPDEPLVTGTSQEIFEHYKLTPQGFADAMLALRK
ncbi:MAG: transketolase family protein [Bacillota bacterium]